MWEFAWLDTAHALQPINDQLPCPLLMTSRGDPVCRQTRQVTWPGQPRRSHDLARLAGQTAASPGGSFATLCEKVPPSIWRSVLDPGPHFHNPEWLNR